MFGVVRDLFIFSSIELKLSKLLAKFPFGGHEHFDRTMRTLFMSIVRRRKFIEGHSSFEICSFELEIVNDSNLTIPASDIKGHRYRYSY